MFSLSKGLLESLAGSPVVKVVLGIDVVKVVAVLVDDGNNVLVEKRDARRGLLGRPWNAAKFNCIGIGGQREERRARTLSWLY